MLMPLLAYNRILSTIVTTKNKALTLLEVSRYLFTVQQKEIPREQCSRADI